MANQGPHHRCPNVSLSAISMLQYHFSLQNCSITWMQNIEASTSTVHIYTVSRFSGQVEIVDG